MFISVMGLILSIASLVGEYYGRHGGMYLLVGLVFCLSLVDTLRRLFDSDAAD